MDSFDVVDQPVDLDQFIVRLMNENLSGWIFRGQGDSDRDLRTSLERNLSGVDKRARIDAEQRLIGFFKDHARLHLGEVPRDQDLRGWLGLMQHYRAPTRLLDWTESPLIALYFAFETAKKPRSGLRTVWALRAGMLRRSVVHTVRDHLGNVPTREVSGISLSSQLGFEKNLLDREYGWAGQDWDVVQNELLVAFIRQGGRVPLVLLPPRPDQRMTNQQAVFTCDGALDGGLDQDLELEGYPVLKRIDLPDAWRAEVLRRLRMMGISAQMIYPGLDGLGEATAALSSTEWDMRAWLER